MSSDASDAVPDTPPDPFRLLVVTPYMETGGAEKVVLDLAMGFVARGNRVDVVSRAGRLVPELVSRGIGHHSVDNLGSKNPLTMLRNARALRRLVALLRPTVINVHAFSLLPVVRLALLGLRAAPRVVFTLHIPERDSYFPIMARTIGLLCDHTVSVCAWSRNRLMNLGAEGHRISVIYNGVNADHFQAQREMAQGSRRLRVGMVARMVTRKGHATLIRSLAALRAAGADIVDSVHFFGDGPERSKLESMSVDNDLDAMITFHGDCRDVRKAYDAIDVMVLPSSTEGLPLTIVEAMCAGVVVCATPVNGVPEVVIDGETGRLFPVGDDAALAQTIVGLYHDPASLQYMADNALELVRSRFGISTMLDGYAEIFTRRIAAEQGTTK